MGALRKAILTLANQHPVTKGHLARQLNRNRGTIKKALDSLTRRGLIQKRKIRVRWLGNHTTPVILYHTPESSSQLPKHGQNDVLNPETPETPPCLKQAYQHQLYTQQIYANLKNPTLHQHQPTPQNTAPKDLTRDVHTQDPTPPTTHKHRKNHPTKQN